MASTSALALHRCRFLEATPSGIVCVSLHPHGTHAAVAREDGSVQLWAVGSVPNFTSSSFSGSSSSSSSSSSSAAPPSSPTDSLAAWSHLSTIAGTASVRVRSLCWAPLKSRTLPGIEGARLFASSFDGLMYECDFVSGTLVTVGESNAGAIWMLACFDVQLAGGDASSGCVLAAGCEDGSIRLLHVSTHSRSLDHIVACPGTDGRVMSVCWHPNAPVLFAGTATGTIRGYDFSAIVQRIIDAHAAAQAKRAANAASRAKKSKALVSKQQQQKKKEKEEDNDNDDNSDTSKSSGESDDSSDSSDDDEGPLLSLMGTVGSTGGGGRGGGVGPRPSVWMQLDSSSARGATRKPLTPAQAAAKSAATTPRIIWSLAVLKDMTVLSGDSHGEVNSWDGRMGTLSSSVPLVRAEGGADVLCVSAGEDAMGTATLAAGTGDARVFLLTRAPVSPSTASTVAEVSSASSADARWVSAGSHTAHASDVRCVAVCSTTTMTSSGAGGSGSWVASGGADAQLAVVRVSDMAGIAGSTSTNSSSSSKNSAFAGSNSSSGLSSFSPHPRIVPQLGQGPHVIDVASRANLLVSYLGASVQVFGLLGADRLETQDTSSSTTTTTTNDENSKGNNNNNSYNNKNSSNNTHNKKTRYPGDGQGNSWKTNGTLASSVSVGGLSASTAAALAGVSDSDASLLLQIDVPSIASSSSSTLSGVGNFSSTQSPSLEDISANITNNTPSSSAAIPESQPVAVAISPAGLWLAYAAGGTGSGRIPRLVRLQHKYDQVKNANISSSSRSITGLLPSHVEIPARLSKLLTSFGSTNISRLALVPLTSSSTSVSAPPPIGGIEEHQALLLVVAGTRMHVCLCIASATAPENTSYNGSNNSSRKRGRKTTEDEDHDEEESKTNYTECRYLYTLPIPHAHGEKFTVASVGAASTTTGSSPSNTSMSNVEGNYSRGTSGGGARGRSGTQDSGTLERIIMMGNTGNGVDGYGDDDGGAADNSSGSSDEADSKNHIRGGSKNVSNQQRFSNKQTSSFNSSSSSNNNTNNPLALLNAATRSTTNIVTLPLYLTTLQPSASADGKGSGQVLVAIATTSRHVHVYNLSASAGVFVLTLPRLPCLPTAIALSSFSSTNAINSSGISSSSSTTSNKTNNIAVSTASSAFLTIALRDASLAIFDPLTGRCASWSTVPGDKSKFPRAFTQRLLGDPIRYLVPLSTLSSSSSKNTSSGGASASEKGERGCMFRLLAFGVSSTASIRFDSISTLNNNISSASSLSSASQKSKGGIKNTTATTTNTNAGSKNSRGEQLVISEMKPSSDDVCSSVVEVTTSISDKYQNIIAAGMLISSLQAVGDKHDDSSAKKPSSAMMDHVVIAEVPWRVMAARVLPVTVSRKKYGT